MMNSLALLVCFASVAFVAVDAEQEQIILPDLNQLAFPDLFRARGASHVDGQVDATPTSGSWLDMLCDRCIESMQYAKDHHEEIAARLHSELDQVCKRFTKPETQAECQRKASETIDSWVQQVRSSGARELCVGVHLCSPTPGKPPVASAAGTSPSSGISSTSGSSSSRN